MHSCWLGAAAQSLGFGNKPSPSLGLILTPRRSMGETLFPDGSAYVGILGTLSALFGLRKSWRESA